MENISKINEYMVQKRCAIIVDPSDYVAESQRVSQNIVFGALANLETWAYTADIKLVENLLCVSEETFLKKYYEPLVDTLKHLKGDDVSHDHFVFQNFPDSCREIPLQDLSAMRFARYYTVLIDEIFGTDLTSEIMDGEKPEYIDRPDLKKDELTTIGSANIEAFYELNRNLIGSKSALSSLDREIIDFSISSNDIPNKEIIPKEIPYKETLALMLKYDMERNLGLNIEFSSYKDFKRALAILSDQDPALKTPKLRKFSNDEKRYLLQKLEGATKKNPDIVKSQMYADRHYVYHLAEYWKMNRYKDYMPKTNEIFSLISQKDKIMTPERRKGEAIKQKDSMALLTELKKQPGELFRNLYFMLDNAKSEKEVMTILNTAEKCAINVPNNILLSTRSEILASVKPNLIKTAFPHGNTRKALQFENKRKPLPKEICDKVDKICCDAVVSRLSTKLDYSGKKIFISDKMKNCPVPFAIKDESSSTRTLTKGTKFCIDGLEKNSDTEKDILGIENEKEEYLRMFVYKKIASGGFVDLSVSFLDKNCELVDQCSWTNLKTDDTGKPLAVHSGDGYDCQKGLSEFIDIDLNVLEKHANEKGITYLAMQIYSYDHIPFNKMDQCFAGIMKCDDMIKSTIPAGERYKIFDPKMVKDKIDLTGSECVSVPFFYNVNTREIIVGDIAIKGANTKTVMSAGQQKLHEQKLMEYAKRCHISEEAVRSMPTLESCQSVVANVTRNIIENHYPTLYDLYSMAAIAGGASLDSFVSTKEEADIAFSWDGTITPYDRDVITSNFMTVENEYMETLKQEPQRLEKINSDVRSGYNYDMFLALKDLDVVKEMLSEDAKEDKIEVER